MNKTVTASEVMMHIQVEIVIIVSLLLTICFSIILSLLQRKNRKELRRINTDLESARNENIILQGKVNWALDYIEGNINPSPLYISAGLRSQLSVFSFIMDKNNDV